MGSETVKCCHSVPERGKHCIHCGARFTLLADGTVQVGPSEAALLAALYRAIVAALVDAVDDLRFRDEACWFMRKWGLATTDAEAADLWARMKEAK
jgi:hypothetical protein